MDNLKNIVSMEYLKKLVDSQLDDQRFMIGSAVATGLLGLVYLTRRYVERAKYTKKNYIDGQVVIITGCNTGLGKASAMELAKRGAKLYLACRDMKKCEAVRTEIIAETKNYSVFARELDLGSLESIRQFSESFHKEEKTLDILMNNAGLGFCPKTFTKDGFETVFGVNHLGHFLLTNLLLDLLKAAAPSRIVVLSSSAHTRGNIVKDNLMLENSYGKFQAYCNSKLANNLFTIHLAKLLTGTKVTVNAVHPGGVRTDIGRHMHWLLLAIIAPITMLLTKSVESGAQTQIQVALDPELESVSGKYFADCKETEPAKQALDYDMAKWLWDKSAELTGLETM